MDTSKLEINQLKQLIQKKINHTYLKKYIQVPVIDEDKLHMLIIMMNNTKHNASSKKQIVVATMLLQMALDTHDLIPAYSESKTSEEDKTSQQLTVLAGDYYSGLYYLLLSEIKEIKMIQGIAAAAKEINEYKMKLYYKEFQDFQQLMTIIIKIESLLIVKVAEYLNIPTISDTIENILLFKRLLYEKDDIINKGSSAWLDKWGDSSTLHSNPSVLTDLEECLERTRQILNHDTVENPPHIATIIKRLKQVINHGSYDNSMSIAEDE